MPRQEAKSYTPVTIDYVAAISGGAVKVGIGGRGREVWIPKSQIHGAPPAARTAEPEEIHVTAWFVKKEGLLD